MFQNISSAELDINLDIVRYRCEGQSSPATTAFIHEASCGSLCEIWQWFLPSLDPLIPHMPIPCLSILSKNQRISMLGLDLDHSLEVVGSSTRQAGAITGPHGPRKASLGGHYRNDGKVQSTVTRKALSLAGRALSRACGEEKGTFILSTYCFLGSRLGFFHAQSLNFY